MRTVLALVAGLVLASVLAAPASAQPQPWRFGLEDTWAFVGSVLDDADAERLLARLAPLTAPQAGAPDVNINGTGGGWSGMQPFPTSPISFRQADRQVRLLQAHGFAMLWNLRPNAPWAKAGNDDCWNTGPITACAPGPDHEAALQAYVRAVVERYDGDGVRDMGWETPDDPTDDLVVPVRRYLMTGEIEFAGATPMPEPGYGDDALTHFWTDSIDHLLRTHRLVRAAIREADPSGQTRLVCSGGVFWDLYTDFPDWPAVDGPAVRARLEGANNHGARYVESVERLATMLRSFGDDADGVECDYLGWHPHNAWREIEQTFAFIRAHAGDRLPIYVDDMWANIALGDRADAPGNTLFTGGGPGIEGDFPNDLLDSYARLRSGVVFDLVPGARDWYYGRGSRHLVKAFASAFGEGAERVSYSGIADFGLDRLGLTGHINLLGTLAEDFAEKPGYHTYGLMVRLLHDFASVQELPVSADPRTRAYRFERPDRGPVLVLWSETGAAPPGLDYRIPTGETVTIDVGADRVLVTHVIDEPGRTEPDVEVLEAPGGRLTLRLGYAPVFVEPGAATEAGGPGLPEAVVLEPVAPNPAWGAAVLRYRLAAPAVVRLEAFDVLGRRVAMLDEGLRPAGVHRRAWRLEGLAAGLYVVRLHAGAAHRAAPVLIAR